MNLTKEWKIKALREILGPEHQIKGNEHVFFCPKCKHWKAKLSINVVTDVVHCWVCDKELSGRTLIPALRLGGKRNPYYIQYLKEIQGSGKKKVEERKYEKPQLPKEFRTLGHDWKTPWYKAALRYLMEERGISWDDILMYKLGYCEDGPYKNRIIIPSFDDTGALNFVIGRSIYPDGMKYKHEDICKDVIWNDCMLDWNRPLTVTEGQFDAIVAGENATSLQGSILNEGSLLFDKIVEQGNDVYFAMDSDAFKKQMRIIELFLSYGIRSYYVELHGAKDVADLGRESFSRAKEEARRVRSTWDVMRIRLEHCV